MESVTLGQVHVITMKGAVMYELLSGTAPHYSEDIPSMYHNIKKAKLKPLKGVSDKAKNLVTVREFLKTFLAMFP